MTTAEAERIIKQFHNSIEDLRPIAVVQPKEKLPHTPAKIKYAHFIYGEELIKTAKIAERILQEIMESYGIIDSFFREDHEKINIKYKEYLNGLKNGIITDFHMPNPFGEIAPVNEFHNFLGELWFNEHNTDLFTGNALGAFIYDELRNKATKEKNLKLLIDIVNTSLTRAVDFPGKKSNAESIFVNPI